MAETVSDNVAPHASATNRVTIMGMDLNSLTQAELVERVFRDLDGGLGGWTATPNVHILLSACATEGLSIWSTQPR